MNIFKRVIRIISYVLITCCFIGLIFCAVSSDNLSIVEYKYSSNGKVEFSCLVISDYHHRSLKFSNGNMIDKIKEQGHVDYVFFTGDLIDSHTKSLDDVKEIFKVSNEISDQCYFVTGNHEQYAPRWSELQEELEKQNIINLSDKEELLSNNVHLFGLEDARFKVGGDASFNKRAKAIKDTIDKEFKNKIDEANLNVLLVHRPENFKMIAKNYNFDLVISGHTHGGQFRIGSWVPTSIFQEEGDYMGGKYHRNNSTLVVSRGLGYSAMFPLRVNCNPEIVKITVSK